MICGIGQEEVCSLNLMENDDQAKLLNQLEEVAHTYPDNEYLLLVDIFGGSCFQVAKKFLLQHSGAILTGVNLNTMLEAQLGAAQGLGLAQLVEKLQNASHKGIQVITQ